MAASGATSASSSSGANPPSIVEQAHFRWHIYRLLILVSCACMIGKILVVESRSGNTPFLSANDRSRWCTIRSLGDEQTYIIDSVIMNRDATAFDPDWNTIDKVVHRGSGDELHYYSSKPTLLPTLLAGEYLIVKWATGWTLAEHPFRVARVMLILTNVVPLMFCFFLLAMIVERYARRPWTRLFVMVVATFATFLTTFATTLNNHVPAAISVMVTLYCLLGIWFERKQHPGYFVVAGLMSAFAAANELPALSFFVAAGSFAFIRSPKWTVLGFVPGAMVVAAGFFATNQLAHQSWRPPYAHRSDGPVIETLEFDLTQELDDLKIPDEVRQVVDREARRIDVRLSNEAVVYPARKLGKDDERRWEIYDPDGNEQLVILEVAPKTAYQLREWDDWYDYENSYWLPGKKSPIDQGEPSQGWYTFHMAIGHHGVFSLTPVWLISLVGIAAAWGDRRSKLKWVGAATLALFLVCFLFYAFRPLVDRNYGGVSSGLRWLFWFIPLWLICMIPACDRLCRYAWFQRACEVCLLISVVSSTYSSLNPWVHPWLYAFFGPEVE